MRERHRSNRLRLRRLQPVGNPLDLENQATYGYSATDGRLAQISNPQISNQIFTYSYLQNSSLLDQISGAAHTVTNIWEPDRDVLKVKQNKVGNTIISKYDYAVNAIGQRSTLSQTGAAFASVRSIAWGYDSYGQLTSAESTIAGQDRAYQYDAIGNRQKSADTLTFPGLDNYTANALNQYSAITHPGFLEIYGKAPAGQAITVNNLATTRQGTDFRRELGFDNSGGRNLGLSRCRPHPWSPFIFQQLALCV